MDGYVCEGDRSKGLYFVLTCIGSFVCVVGSIFVVQVEGKYDIFSVITSKVYLGM